MAFRMLGFVAVVTLASGGCDSSSSNSGSSNAPSGALPCTRTPVECRASFYDTYDGTYQGDASGTFALDINIIGGITGTGPAGVTITGQVDEYGRVTFAFSDGTEFTGQFNADLHSMSGTWTSAAGKGTFVAQSSTISTGTGGTGGTGNTSTPAASTVVATAEQACQKSVSCGTATASDCTSVGSSLTASTYPQACWDEDLALFQCMIDNTCSTMDSACADALQLELSCFDNPDFNPAYTGIASFDEIVHLCTACTAEAKACYDATDCKAYAQCVDGCSDSTCDDACSTSHSAGFLLYSKAATCEFDSCW